MSSCHYTFKGNESIGKLKYQAKLGKIGTHILVQKTFRGIRCLFCDSFVCLGGKTSTCGMYDNGEVYTIMHGYILESNYFNV
jgi:hypothetical protein